MSVKVVLWSKHFDIEFLVLMFYLNLCDDICIFRYNALVSKKRSPTTLVWREGSNNNNKGRIPEGIPEEEIYQ